MSKKSIENLKVDENGEVVRAIRFKVEDWIRLINLGDKYGRTAQKQVLLFVNEGFSQEKEGKKFAQLEKRVSLLERNKGGKLKQA